jgi:hypothetical protein
MLIGCLFCFLARRLVAVTFLRVEDEENGEFVDMVLS